MKNSQPQIIKSKVEKTKKTGENKKNEKNEKSYNSSKFQYILK